MQQELLFCSISFHFPFQSVLQKVVVATQHGNSLCSLLEEFEYWSSFPAFKECCTENGSRILHE